MSMTSPTSVRARLAAVVLTTLLAVIGLGGAAVADSDESVPARGSISGRVTVPAGVDVTKVSVYAWLDGVKPGAGGWASPAADGRYTIEDLVPGDYRIEFVGWNVALLHQYWPDAAYHADSRLVTVGQGPVMDKDARMELGATLSGTIRTDGVANLWRVRVSARGAPGRVIPTAAVHDDGRWVLRGIPSGDFNIVFDGRDVGLAREYWNTTGDPNGLSVISVTAGRTYTGIDIRLNGPGEPAAVESYVTRIYADLFGRVPDRPGLVNWTAALLNGTPSSAVTNAITSSDEYRIRMIRSAYRQYLGRNPESAGQAAWLAAMRSGMHIEDMQARILASPEVYARAGGTDRDWVASLYRTVLGRAPSAAERDGWTAHLASGSSRIGVARGFLYSTEHLSTVVDGYYRDLLGRPADPAGRTSWVRLIQSGARDEEVIARLVSSQEYRTQVVRDHYTGRQLEGSPLEGSLPLEDSLPREPEPHP